MKPIEIISAESPENILAEIIDRLHFDGPIKQEDLETLSYLKYFHPKILEQRENKLMYLMGLFYKTEEPGDMVGFAYQVFSQAILDETGRSFTPVQASIRNKIAQNRYFSFSAPTSAGKSFLFRELIKDEEGDIVIVVPSRALIAEYMLVVRETLKDHKDILILQFIDDVNKNKTSRRIFIVTPERAAEIFKLTDHFNPSLFLYDEAQISEEIIRGTRFDAFVRRSDRVFPHAKKVFAHPFIQNPEAQLNKHEFFDAAEAKSYPHNTVGKIYLQYDKNRSAFECFSPFIEGAYLKINKTDFPEDPVEKYLQDGGSMLIYVSKESIYNKKFEESFSGYISLCEPITDPAAIKIINEVEEIIGAEDKQSEMIDLMKQGVVIHHGSVPLNVRFLIERFTNDGFARICFATSTLIQGVNMPFDIVWIDNGQFTGTNEDKTLGLKNLIGRAGRNTDTKSEFDYGFVIVKNSKSFIERFNGQTSLSDVSQLEKNPEEITGDYRDFIEAVKNDDMNDDYNLPNSKADRLKSEETINFIKTALDALFTDGRIIRGTEYRALSKIRRNVLKNALAGIYEASLGRNLKPGEVGILATAITILLWQIQGKSFKELLSLRYRYLTNQDEQRRLRRAFRQKEISSEEYNENLSNIHIEYSAIPHLLPDAKLMRSLPSRFRGKKLKDFNYDLMVYDTYDFLDKVISFSLRDVFVAAFDQYYELSEDERAKEMVNYFMFGTNDSVEIWLMRYGFSIEEAEIIKEYVQSIDENEITFSLSIYRSENTAIREMVERYL